MKTESQNKQIYNFLKEGMTLTAYEALSMFGSFRLSARILDIKQNLLQKNEVIESKLITKNNKRFAQYKLITV
jgi:hypothetical protein